MMIILRPKKVKINFKEINMDINDKLIRTSYKDEKNNLKRRD